MDPIKGDDRIVANFREATYQAYRPGDAAYDGFEVLQLDESWPLGLGFFILKIPAGRHTRIHEHTENEQFIVLDGELIDHDGAVYRAGDFVLLKKGTRHNSHSPEGCHIAAYIPKALKREGD